MIQTLLQDLCSVHTRSLCHNFFTFFNKRYRLINGNKKQFYFSTFHNRHFITFISAEEFNQYFE